jgi:quinol monooxygenase YgiN
MNNHYALINKLTTRPGRRDEVMEILLEAGRPFQGNPSCLLYLVNADAEDPDVIWVEDLWTSRAEHSVAMNDSEIRPHVARAIPLLAGMPEQIEIIPVGGKGFSAGQANQPPAETELHEEDTSD